MRKTASEIIRTLEMRVARLERQASFGHLSKSSSYNKRAFLSGLVSKVGDFYAYLKRDLPGEKEKKKILSKMASDLEKELLSSINGFKDYSWAGKTKGKVKCAIQSNQLVISISIDTLSHHSLEMSKNLKISDMSDLGELKNYYEEIRDLYYKSRGQSHYSIPMNLWQMVLEIITKTLEMPLFFPLLHGDLETLIDRVDAPLKKEFEREFWKKLEKYSSIVAKVLKALATVGVGALVIKLIISVLMLIPYGLIGMGILAVLKYLSAGLMIVAGGVLGKYLGNAVSGRTANEVPKDPEERLELFLEILEQEGVA